jgi:hypothetical protein
MIDKNKTRKALARQTKVKVVAVKYHAEELKLLDKKRKSKPRAVFIREKSLE